MHNASEIKAQNIVPKPTLLVLSEMALRVLHRVPTSRVAQKRTSKPLLARALCEFILAGKYQLRKHQREK